MKNIKRFISVFVSIFIIFSISAYAFGASTANIQIEVDDWQGDRFVPITVDFVSVTNVSRKLDKIEHPVPNFSKYFVYLEVTGSTTITTLEDEDEVYVCKVEYSDGDYQVIREYYQDDEHKVVEESGYEYYTKGSYIKLTEPGEYIVYGSYCGSLDLGSIAYIKIVPDAKKAVPTTSKIIADGKEISFDAYNIDGNNYFKLRDLAMVVSGTNKQFDVVWNGEKKTIDLISNKAYTPVGGELAKGDGTIKKAVLSTSDIYRDGELVKLTAYNINGNNYFKLRDVAKVFNIGVTWDSETKTVGIDTNSDYIDE